MRCCSERRVMPWTEGTEVEVEGVMLCLRLYTIVLHSVYSCGIKGPGVETNIASINQPMNMMMTMTMLDDDDAV